MVLHAPARSRSPATERVECCPSTVRALVVVLLLCGIARAAPKYQHTPSTSSDPAMVAAERKWTIAAASRGPAQSDLWEDAASAFIAIADAGKLDNAELVLAARAALAAFKNAWNVDPRTREKPAIDEEDPFGRKPIRQDVTSRDQRMIHLLEVAARFETDPDELASLAFLRANIWRRYNQFEMAIPIFVELLEKHRMHEVAEYSANLLLDIYNRTSRFDEMIALATKLRADKRFLAKRPELAITLRKIHAQAQTLAARAASQRAHDTGDRSHFEKCGEAYLAIIDPDPTERATTDDEALYSAMICFEQAGSTDRALEVLRRLTTDHPDSQLSRRAELHAISMLATIGHIDAAATAGERWLRRNTIERDAPDILEDTIRWRVATGSLDVAVRVLEDYTTRARRLPQLLERRGAIAVSLAASILEDARTKRASDYSSRRALAIRILARPPPLTRTIHTDGSARVAVANVYAAAACPVALVDGLCKRPREAGLMATARRELTRSPNPNDGATLLLADLALEAILYQRAPTANLSADYQHLTSSANPDIRVAARARLAALAHHAKNATERAKQLDACITESYTSRAGDTWRVICERERAIDREVLPAPRAPAPFALEPPLVPMSPTASRALLER